MAPKQSALAFLLTLLATRMAATSLQPRDYADEVCKPATTSSTDTIPPCLEIENIEAACAPNGTEPIDFAAHAQCMCGGSYFAEWTGCQDCLVLHGLRTERDDTFFRSVEAVASHSLCDFLSVSGATTPTAAFADIFSVVENTLTSPTTGATVSSDRAVSQTAVSLYYTPSGSQGPGAITGDAAKATATKSTTKAAATTTSKASTSTKASSGSGISTTASESSTSTSKAGAVPTQAAGGLLLGMAGLAVAAGL